MSSPLSQRATVFLVVQITRAGDLEGTLRLAALPACLTILSRNSRDRSMGPKPTRRCGYNAGRVPARIAYIIGATAPGLPDRSLSIKCQYAESVQPMFEIVYRGVLGAFVLVADVPTHDACTALLPDTPRLVRLVDNSLLSLGRDATLECLPTGTVTTQEAVLPASDAPSGVRVHESPGAYVSRSWHDLRREKYLRHKMRGQQI